ncbi:sigma-70 family RNA polymerase sigma factor [Photobacterium carnosum]|uniref:RNA polymerase n=2 Tax=Photobacterium carnosum TaxID=2023717 RepID=A0A2N4UP40_9GAMM|nr:RNA polymerase [Photobacterium carnosum]MCD9494342.1 sigma-70 family RNA polymerase sigma factor [Photobacterium carnosum]MCD9497271.1 sigma-70 family RNA polymerase sigma factor [Photobacterium carnosum]MCD9514700.1 sigma-70 family RNA polymerase sigma factor [Photobacterium carnosum]MCD9521727.1 sigma-70 family RNA polymerase sigma factor [Photobacterium carnosum]
MMDRNELIEAARQGSSEATEQLLIDWQPTLKKMAFKQCTSNDVDDAVQESLAIIWRRIGTLKTVEAFPGWLLIIIKRECSKLMKSNNNLDELPEDYHELFSYYSSPELRLDIIAAIHSLPEKYRSVILLRDLEELSIGEIADKLLLTRMAVKSRIHRGRLMMQEYLEK